MNSLVLLLLLTTVILVGLLLIQNRRVIFFTACAFVFTPFDYIDRFFFTLPSAIRWLPFLVIVSLAAITALLPYKEKIKIPKSLLIVYGFILMFSIASLLMNRTSFLAMLVAQRGYIIIFSFLILMRNAFGRFTKEQLYAMLVWIGILHFPIALFQRIVFVSLLKIESGDMVSGLLPVDGFYLFFQCTCLFITLNYWLHGKRIINRLSTELILVLLLGSIAIGANKAGFIFLMFTFGFVLLRSPLYLITRQLRKIVIAGFAVCLTFITFTIVYNQEFADNEQSTYTSLLTDPAFFIRYNFAGSSERSQFTPSGRLKRGAAITFSWDHINDNIENILAGLGPGATAESNLAGAGGHLANRYPNYYINRVAMAMYLGDLGILGLALHVAFLLCLWWCRPVDIKSGSSLLSIDRRIREGFIVLSMLFYTYENLYFEPVFALLIALMAYPYMQRSDATDDKKVVDVQQHNKKVSIA